MELIDYRPKGKPLRAAEQAAREAGATDIAWAKGGKHIFMLITLPDGTTIRQSLPKGANARDDWAANWTRQRVQRALAGRRL